MCKEMSVIPLGVPAFWAAGPGQRQCRNNEFKMFQEIWQRNIRVMVGQPIYWGITRGGASMAECVCLLLWLQGRSDHLMSNKCRNPSKSHKRLILCTKYPLSKTNTTHFSINTPSCLSRQTQKRIFDSVKVHFYLHNPASQCSHLATIIWGKSGCQDASVWWR